MFWETYGEFCKGEFDNIGYEKEIRYKFIIYKKNYVGLIYSALCGQNPATLKYLNDDLFGIKGAELKLTLINIENQFPLSLFYTEADDVFKILFYSEYSKPDPDTPSIQIPVRKSIFSGYLLQDELKEMLTDTGHEIEITFTDNLGLLKDISFGDAIKLSPSANGYVRPISAYITTTQFPVAQNNIIKIQTGVFNQGSPQKGDYIYIPDTQYGTLSFTIIDIKQVGADLQFEVDEKIPFTFLNYPIKLYYITGYNLQTYLSYAAPIYIYKQKKIRLGDVIRICLHATGLGLNTNYISNISVEKNKVLFNDIFDNIYISMDTLRDGDSYLSCYDILNKLCERFLFTIFQSNLTETGINTISNPEWFFVRYPEYKYDIPFEGFCYDIYFIKENKPKYNYSINYDIGFIEYGIEETIQRPVKSIMDSFGFKFPDEVLYNSNLSNTDKYVQTYITPYIGYNNRKTIIYKAHGFFSSPEYIPNGYNYDANIWVLYADDYINELERWIVIQPNISMWGPNGYSGLENITACQALSIEVNENDKIKYSFQYRCYPISAQNALQVGLRLTGVSGNEYWCDKDGNWVQNLNALFWVTIDEATGSEFISANINTNRFPENGLLTIFLGQYSVYTFGSIDNPPRTIYKDISISYEANAGSGVNIKGHENSANIFSQIKNTEKRDIVYDCTNTNVVNGTLFLPIEDDAMTIKANEWSDGQTTNIYRLGNIVSLQHMNWLYLKRLQLSGKFLGIFKGLYNPSLSEWQLASPVCIIKSSIKPNSNFAFSRMEYNFKEDYIEADIYEIFNDSEIGGNSQSNELIKYNFKYLYK